MIVLIGLNGLPISSTNIGCRQHAIHWKVHRDVGLVGAWSDLYKEALRASGDLIMWPTNSYPSKLLNFNLLKLTFMTEFYHMKFNFFKNWASLLFKGCHYIFMFIYFFLHCPIFFSKLKYELKFFITYTSFY